LALLDKLTQVIPLAEAPQVAQAFLTGSVKGRVVVDVNA
jgi:acrylyl-CoA reductase (NADPH)